MGILLFSVKRTTQNIPMSLILISPRRSCDQGGRKVFLVFSSSIPTDMEPVFRVFTKPREEHYQVLRECIILVTPAQPNLGDISDMECCIKLGTRTKTEGAEGEEELEFSYLPHPYLPYNQHTECVFCQFNCD